MLKGLDKGSDLRGPRPYLFYDPKQLGLWNTAMTHPTPVTSRQLNVEGFGHFQIGFEVAHAFQMRVRIYRGQIVDWLEFTSRVWTLSYVVNINPTNAGRYHTIYWGLNAPATTASGDSFRFARTLILDFAMVSGSSTTLSAWLECMG